MCLTSQRPFISVRLLIRLLDYSINLLTSPRLEAQVWDPIHVPHEMAHSESLTLASNNAVSLPEPPVHLDIYANGDTRAPDALSEKERLVHLRQSGVPPTQASLSPATDPLPTTSTTTMTHALPSVRRREEDAGILLDVADFEDDLDDSSTLPPAYNEIRHSRNARLPRPFQSLIFHRE